MNQFNKKTILIVEDSPDILSALKMFLEIEGYHVLTAENGLQAMITLVAFGTPSIIIFDLKMNSMDGEEFSKKVRHHCNPPPTMILMSGTSEIKIKALELRADGWLAKPFMLNDLLLTVKNFTA